MAVKVDCVNQCDRRRKMNKGKCAEKASAAAQTMCTHMSMKASEGIADSVIQTQLKTVSQQTKPSSVLIGATALGRLSHRGVSTRFHTGLTADCTTLDIRSNTDMIQIRPGFWRKYHGSDRHHQITATQFATVRYKVMDKAEKITRMVR